MPALGLEFRFGQVVAVDVASGEARQVASGGEDPVHIDPDGAFLLVSRERRGSDKDVWRTWIDGSGRPDEQVTNQKDVFHCIADDTGTVRMDSRRRPGQGV